MSKYDPQTRTVAGGYTRLADQWDQKYTDARALAEDRYVFDFIRRNKFAEGHVLDLGCGTGLVLSHLAIPPSKYLGLDISEGMLKQAAKKFPRHTFSQVDMAQFPPGIRRFDSVVSTFASFSYTPHPRKTAYNIRRVLRPGGTFMVMPYGMGSIRNRAYEVEVDGEHLERYTYSVAALQDIFRAFHNVQIHGLTLLADRLPPTTSRRMADAAVRLDSGVLGKLFPESCYFMIVTGTR